jgi:indole-3-glycerol phosphate synthase
LNALDEIVARTRAEVTRRRREVPLGAVSSPRADRPFADALRRPGVSLIAEHKRRSPSAGAIRSDASLQDVVGAYERGGAAALSVLTEGPSFGGSLDDLRAARACSRLPVLRKDFIVDAYQIDEAVLAGADAILLIVAALDDRQLAALGAYAEERGLSALVEVHDRLELERALASGASIVGVNNRDLKTLEVDSRTSFELLPLVPSGTVTVAESGFSRSEEVAALRDAGADAVLIGEALMRAADIEAACRALVGAL